MESGGGRSDLHPLTEEEEAIKRNTDCVYFLASPLTCKKGSECEYRHSEGVRINPRDCKFWFGGNCLNPKCLFRHPPLDGLVGNPVSTSVPIMTSTAMHLTFPSSSAYNLNRNGVPCYYFQMGTCLKGDKCNFIHFPQHAVNPVAKQIEKDSAPVGFQLQSHKKDSWKVKECNNPQNPSNALSLTVKPVPLTAKISMTLEKSNNSHLVHKKNILPSPTRNGLRISQTTGVLVGFGTGLLQPSLQSDKHNENDREAGEILEEPSGVCYDELDWPLKLQPRPSQDLNDKWADEVFRESSPGFDVLVDDVVNDADYLHEKDGFRNGSVQGARNLNHHSGHDSTFRSDRNWHHGVGDGERCGNTTISERILDKPLLPVRRSAHRLGSSDGIDESDLRHRLMKHRRLNGSLSATISGRESEPYSSRHELKKQDRNTHNSYRDRRQLFPENSISSRLRGRMRLLPKASSPEFPSALQSGSWGRHSGELSPVRLTSLHGRLGERLRSCQKSMEDSSSTSRNFGSQQKERHDVDPLGFAGPRSLAELKGAKADGISMNIHSLSSPEHNGVKTLKADSEVSVSFDGPKSLSDLRKRNREAAPKNDAITSDGDIKRAFGETEICSSVPKAVSVPELYSHYVPETRLDDTKAVVEEDEVYIPSVVEQITYTKQQAEDDVTETGDAAEDYEIDYTNQREGEYDYETGGRDYKVEDENMDPMNVDIDDDDDEDDFAKKIGLIFS